MKSFQVSLIFILIAFCSCKDTKKSIPENPSISKRLEIFNIVHVDSTKNSNREEFLDTQFEYSDSLGNSLLILNSFPKGGQKYTDPQGNNYVYAVFWTQFINKTNQALDIKINFPSEDQELSSSPEIRYKLFLPPTKMSDDKIHQMNYGLSNMDFILDRILSQETQLDRSIQPNETEIFYVIVLTSQGVDGTIRAGLELENQNLFYKLNQKRVSVGTIQF